MIVSGYALPLHRHLLGLPEVHLGETRLTFPTRKTLALNPDTNIALDLRTVERAYILARTDRSSRVPSEKSASPPLLQSAAAYYHGDFLTRFSPDTITFFVTLLRRCLIILSSKAQKTHLR
jgi:hypothetical protein